ncbi:ABC transporter permease [Actinocatenispora rupis]|uniref:Peptide ABC transporter permease n=1 Tax=Actinocatenispora rupis TaxID=519421 RepID=A0A8J3J4Q6_9ACTN|nr:ABC transporter permease [Actinocatenispora rupis]GID10119.1 peptide ABC transporter permease [Actinocatenispora rupis]
MLRYLLRRLLSAVFVLWAAFTVSFLALYALPGDPVAIMLDSGTGEQGTVDPARAAALRHEYGLDRPLPEQYLDRLVHAVRGDLGTSVRSGTPVTRTVLDAVPPSLTLAAAALLLAVLGGVLLALAATWPRGGWLRRVLTALPPLGVSVPTFWVGLVLVQVFSFRLGWLPAFGGTGPSGLLLPAVTLALPAGAVLAQVLARGLRGALAEPYAVTARARGVGRGRLLLRHAARNAAVPTVTLAGVLTGNLVAGTVVVETVFARDGLGRLTVTAVSTQDIPVVQGVVLFAAAVFVAVNLTVDLLAPVLDPRLAGPATA